MASKPKRSKKKTVVNDRYKRFAREYLIDHNATQAAIRAGYSKKTADKQGSRLLNNADIQALIKPAKEKLSKKLDITAERVIKEYARIAFADMKDLAEWAGGSVMLKPSSELTEDQSRSISEVSEHSTKDSSHIRIKQHSKVQALDSLAKYFKLYTDNTANITIETNELTVRFVKVDKK